MKNSMHSELSAAKGRATAHRLLLRQNIAAAKNRLSPGELKNDVTHKLRTVGRNARDGASRTVSDNRYAVGVGAVAVAAYLLRKPIADVAPKVGHWLSDRYADARVRLGGKDTRPKWWNADRLKAMFRRNGEGSPPRKPQGD